MNRHRMTVQLPSSKGGLVLTPQSASGIAAFYSCTSAFLRWLAQRCLPPPHVEPIGVSVEVTKLCTIKIIQDQPPSLRCQHLRMLHGKVTVNAASRVREVDPGHSILQHDMPDDEDPAYEEERIKKFAHCPAAHPSCLFLGKSRVAGHGSGFAVLVLSVPSRR